MAAGAVEINVRIADAHSVGAYKGYASFSGLFHQLSLRTASILAGFGKTGSDQKHVGYPLFLKLGYQVRYFCRRNCDHPNVDASGNIADALVDRPASYLAALWIDQVNITLVASADSVGQKVIAPLSQPA